MNVHVHAFSLMATIIYVLKWVQQHLHRGSPICQPVHRQPATLQDTINGEVHKMLQQGIIQPSCSPWSSPIVMVQKKDGSWRFCVDYRKLNDVTHHDAYPLPWIDTTLDSLAGSTLFTMLDLASGYWQVEVEPAHKEKTAFSTSTGHFEFNVMPFGLTNTPVTFQRLMECRILPLMYFLELNDILFLVKSLMSPTPAFNILNYVTFNTSTTRSGTFNKLIHNFTSTSHAHHFYFNRIVRLWNSLPYIDLSLSIDTIKSNLHNFFLETFCCTL